MTYVIDSSYDVILPYNSMKISDCKSDCEGNINHLWNIFCRGGDTLLLKSIFPKGWRSETSNRAGRPGISPRCNFLRNPKFMDMIADGFLRLTTAEKALLRNYAAIDDYERASGLLFKRGIEFHKDAVGVL